MIPAIFLAAGASSRMGRTKALLPLPGGESFLARLTRTFTDAGADPVVCVAGFDADALRLEVERRQLPARLAVNPDPGRGQLSSLVTGLDAVAAQKPAAVLVVPVDLPLVTVTTVRQVISTWLSSGAPIVRPTRGGRHGHPVLLAARLFAEFRCADPSLGARAVIQRHLAEIVDVAVDDPGAFDDVDTPEEYERLIGLRTPHSSERAGTE